jgi:hypothetical protein
MNLKNKKYFSITIVRKASNQGGPNMKKLLIKSLEELLEENTKDEIKGLFEEKKEEK